MSRATLLLSLGVLAGCAPSFDRCRIPGTAGCPDGGATPDAGSGCPPAPSGPALFESDFEDAAELDRFVFTGDPAGDWAIEAGELVQRQTMNRGSSALLDELELADVWIRAEVRSIATRSGGAVELAVRGTADDSYHCNWEPTTGEFEIQRDSSRSALAANRVDLSSIAGYEPSMPVTMELRAVGSRLECCLRGIPGASLTVFDDGLATGAPGARTFELSGAFDEMVVRAAP